MIKPTKSQTKIIQALIDNGQMSTKDIVEQTGVSHPTISLFCRLFGALDIIESQFDINDNRSRLIGLKPGALEKIKWFQSAESV